MHKFLKVEGHEGLFRDPTSGAIINRDRSSFEEYKASIAERVNKDAAFIRQAEELNTLKNELNEVKQLLIQLLNKDK